MSVSCDAEMSSRTSNVGTLTLLLQTVVTQYIHADVLPVTKYHSDK